MTDTLASWGRYPAYPQTPTSCYWRGDLQMIAIMLVAHLLTLPSLP